MNSLLNQPRTNGSRKVETICDHLDDAHEAVGKALGMIYKLQRTPVVADRALHQPNARALREVMSTLELVGNFYDEEAGQ